MSKVKKKEKNGATRRTNLIPSTALQPGRILQNGSSRLKDSQKRLTWLPNIKQEEVETDVEDEPSLVSTTSSVSLSINPCLSQRSPVPYSSDQTIKIKQEPESNEDSSNLIEMQTKKSPEKNSTKLQIVGTDLMTHLDTTSPKLVQVNSLHYPKDMHTSEICKRSDDKGLIRPISEKSRELSKFLTLNLNFNLETITSCLQVLNPYLLQSPPPQYLNIVPESSDSKNFPQSIPFSAESSAIVPQQNIKVKTECFVTTPNDKITFPEQISNTNSFPPYKKFKNSVLQESVPSALNSEAITKFDNQEENNLFNKSTESEIIEVSTEDLSQILAKAYNNPTSVPEKRKLNDETNFLPVKKVRDNVACFEPKNALPQYDDVSAKYFKNENNLAANKKNLIVPKVPVSNTSITNVPSKCVSDVQKLTGLPQSRYTGQETGSQCTNQYPAPEAKGASIMSNIKLHFPGNSGSDVSIKLASLVNTVNHIPKNSYLKDPRLNRNLNSKTEPVLNKPKNLSTVVAAKKIPIDLSRNQTILPQGYFSDNYNNKNASQNTSGTVTRSEENIAMDMLTSAVSARKDERGQITNRSLFAPLQNCVIKWKTAWLNLQIQQTPPILSPTEIKEVKNSYESHEEYANTYSGLHQISVWCNITKSVRNNTKLFPCKFQDCKEVNDNYKNKLKMTQLSSKEIPVQQSVILITYTKKNGTQHSLFGFIERVDIRENSGKETSNKNKIFDALLFVNTHEKIVDSLEEHLNIKKLCVIRVAIRQYEALTQGTSRMKAVACQPDKNTGQFQVVHLPNITLFSLNKLESHMNTVISHIKSPEILMTVVCKPHFQDDSMLILLRLINLILQSNFPILICLSDEEKLFKIARKINAVDNSFTVIAIKEKEISVPEDLGDFTLRGKAAKLDKKETEDLTGLEIEKRVIEKSKIILTMLSHVFLGVAKKLPSKTVCLIEDAHLISEADTALAMEMSPQSLLFYGAKEQSRELDQPLQQRHYNKTLFHRLLECETP